LNQIRTGTSLKKLDPEQAKKERDARKNHIRSSVMLLQGLQDTLKEALDNRALSLLDSDSDDEDDDWEDEDEE